MTQRRGRERGVKKKQKKIVALRKKKNGNTPGRRKLNLFTSGVMCVLRIDLLLGVCVFVLE